MQTGFRTSSHLAHRRLASPRLWLGLMAGLAVSLSSCAWKVNSMSYDGVERLPKPGSHPIPIIADTSEVDRPFIIIGLVEADPGRLGNFGGREMLNAMRKEARNMGGDALVNLRRPLSNYSRMRLPSDRDLVARDFDPEARPSYRYVAEVISYSIEPELVDDGARHLPVHRAGSSRQP